VDGANPATPHPTGDEHFYHDDLVALPGEATGRHEAHITGANYCTFHVTSFCSKRRIAFPGVTPKEASPDVQTKNANPTHLVIQNTSFARRIPLRICGSPNVINLLSILSQQRNSGAFIRLWTKGAFCNPDLVNQ